MLLGIVIVLLGLVISAGAFALWSMRTDTGSAGADRLSRQLLACAEQGLTWGKQNIAQSANSGTPLNSYLNTNICSAKSATLPASGSLPCMPNGPFPTGGTGPLPTGYPYTQQITMDSVHHTSPDFEFMVAIYNDPAATNPYAAGANNRVVVYSRCTDIATMQQRAVQAITNISLTQSTDYSGQAGHGFRNQGNQNN